MLLSVVLLLVGTSRMLGLSRDNPQQRARNNVGRSLILGNEAMVAALPRASLEPCTIIMRITMDDHYIINLQNIIVMIATTIITNYNALMCTDFGRVVST